MPLLRQLVDAAYSREITRHLLHRIDFRLCEKRFARLGIKDLLLANSTLEVGGVKALSPAWDDLWTLYSTIRQKKPALVLEYGSGVSTILMAQALWENGAGKLISLENAPGWAEVTRSRLPKRLEEVCQLLVAKPEIVTFKGFFDSRPVAIKRLNGLGATTFALSHRPVRIGLMGLRYREAEGLAPDVILIDGPGWGSVPEYRDSFGNALPSIVLDPLLHERSYKPGTHIVLDWRLPNTMFLVGNLSRRWRFKCDRVRRQNHLVLVD